jgi:hypothetical protein
MKTIATGKYIGESVRITSIWYSAKTGQSYCELWFGESGHERGLRVQFENVYSVVHLVDGEVK